MNAGASPPTRRTALPAALGLAGWLGAGPLVATLLVGRTALLFPSLRWLATAAGAWIVLFVVGWVATGVAWPPNPLSAARRPPSAVLSPLASLLPLLAILYRDDASYHLTTSGLQAPERLLAAYTFTLALAGAGVARLMRTWRQTGAASERLKGDVKRQAGGSDRGGVDERPETRDESVTLARSDGPAGAAGALWTGALAVAAMTALNHGLFGPLAARLPVQPHGAVLVAGNLIALSAAAYVAVRATRAPALAAVSLFAAWLAFAPLTAALPASPVGAAILSATIGLLAVERGRPLRLAGAALVFLALSFAWVPAWGDTPAGPIFWSVPHEQNASAGAFFSRLYAGPGGLTAAEALPVAAAQALTVGTATCFGLLALWFLWLERPLARLRALTATCLALVAVLALWPTTPPSAAAMSVVAMVPFASPALWRDAPASRRIQLAAFATMGYLLAGTSTMAFSRAATEWLSRWPALASLPSLGLVLLALALTLALRCIHSPPADLTT